VNTSINTDLASADFELRFCSLFDAGRGYSFPCDAAGSVDMDSFSDNARNNYFFAHRVIGRDFATPAVLPCSLH
jgi:hypothetical protein